MFAQTSDYALRAAVCLAHAGKPLTTRQIADLTHVPAGYLSKVLQALAKAGLVRSQRGLYGGFSLRVSPEKLTLLRVVNAVDPIHRFERCPIRPKRLEAGLCNLHHRLDHVLGLVEAALAETSIADVIDRPRENSHLCEVTASRASRG